MTAKEQAEMKNLRTRLRFQRIAINQISEDRARLAAENAELKARLEALESKPD